jgi:hypothetical protein
MEAIKLTGGNYTFMAEAAVKTRIRLDEQSKEHIDTFWSGNAKLRNPKGELILFSFETVPHVDIRREELPCFENDVLQFSDVDTIPVLIDREEIVSRFCKELEQTMFSELFKSAVILPKLDGKKLRGLGLIFTSEYQMQLPVEV